MSVYDTADNASYAKTAPPQDGDQSQSGFMVLSLNEDSDNYSIQEINDPACNYLQLNRDSIIKAPLKAIIPQSYHSTLIGLCKRTCQTGNSEKFSYVNEQNGLNSLAGTVFKISDHSVALVIDPQTTSTLSIEVAKRGKQEWEKTVDAIDDIITIQDVEMRIIRANRAAHHLFGYEFGELIGKQCFRAFYNLAEPCNDCPVIQTHMDGKINRHYKYNEQNKKSFDISGSPVFDENGKLSMVVHVARDITATIKQEEERKRLSTAIEQAPDIVIITDRNGTIQYVNPAFTSTTGYSREEALGQNMSILKSGIHEQTFYQDMWAHILAGNVWKGKFYNKRKDGTVYSELSTISPIFNSTHHISSFVTVKRDISREESLERQLQQSVKLEAVGTLAGGIAHDFNNILSLILGYAQIAKGHAKDLLPALSAIDQILLAGERATDLVKQILTFSRKGDSTNQFKVFKIQYIIKEVLKMIRSSLPSTIQLVQDIDSNCKAILADPSQIHQVVMNLCTNARQAIGDEYGEISVHLHEKEITAQDHQTAASHIKFGCYACLEITDNGCGMDERTQSRIFDPFFTTKPKEHGTGLGLSVVHGIVEKHGGIINVSSTIGQGTSFQLLFPTIEAEEKRDVIPEKTDLGGTERIVLVDDEQQLIGFLQHALEKLGYQVISFCNSIDAVQYFRGNSDEFDLVITDMTMPNMTGTELARELLSIRPDVPVIMMSGYSESATREKALRIGIKEFLNKPFKKDALARTLRKVLDNG